MGSTQRQHGTEAARARHRQAGQPLCPACDPAVCSCAPCCCDGGGVHCRQRGCIACLTPTVTAIARRIP